MRELQNTSQLVILKVNKPVLSDKKMAILPKEEGAGGRASGKTGLEFHDTRHGGWRCKELHIDYVP